MDVSVPIRFPESNEENDASNLRRARVSRLQEESGASLKTVPEHLRNDRRARRGPEFAVQHLSLEDVAGPDTELGLGSGRVLRHQTLVVHHDSLQCR